MNPITIPNITIPVIGLPTIGIPSVGFPSASDGGLVWPKGLKESIKAIYDPASQGMTNYDVIEAYAEDFTGWEYRDYRGTAKITNNAIVITNVVETNNIVEDAKEPYSDLTIRVTGVTEDKYLIVRQGRGRPETHIKKDGIYIFPNNNLYFGFAVNKTGDCNITITQLPTSILKDLSGNGNHAYLYGGKGKLNSGMGVYQIDFTSYSKTSVVADVSHNTVKVVPAANNYLFVRYATTEMPAYTVNVQNLGNNVLTYQYATENGRQEITLTEGINEIPESIKAENPYQVGFYVSAGTGEITITQIPDYPNQLCYDGKMYAVCYGFPILTDYAVMADRTWFDIRSVSCFIGKRNRSGDNLGAFEFEFRANQALSFGRTNSIIFADSGIVYQTKNSYNGIGIDSGLLDDTDVLIIGAAQQNINNKPQDIYIGCHGKIIIADRSFTEDEITWLKDNWKKI